MAMRARVIAPGLLHYIVQRGGNRNAVFVELDSNLDNAVTAGVLMTH